MQHIAYDPPVLAYNEWLTLFIFGDLQHKSDAFVAEAWGEFKHQFKTTKGPKAALGVGDYTDFTRPSILMKMNAALNGDDTMHGQLDDMFRRYQDDELLPLMDFLEGRLWGLHEGHHGWKMRSGVNDVDRMAELMNTVNLGWIASTRMNIRRRSKGDTKRSLSYTIISTHGNAGGRGFPAAANWMNRSLVEGYVADHYIMGHACKTGNFEPFERHHVRRSGPVGVSYSFPRCMIVGGFCRGTQTNGWTTLPSDTRANKTIKQPKQGYAEKRGYTPQPMSWGIIRLRITQGKSLAEASGKNVKSDHLEVEQFNKGPSVALSKHQGGMP